MTIQVLEGVIIATYAIASNHQPRSTRVGVTRLGEDDMRVEIEVYHNPVGKE